MVGTGIDAATKYTGPKRVSPAKPVVLVGTPSIDFERKLTSSTYTPGAKYSGIEQLLSSSATGW